MINLNKITLKIMVITSMRKILTRRKFFSKDGRDGIFKNPIGILEDVEVHIAINSLVSDYVSKEDTTSMKFDFINDADSFYDIYNRCVELRVRRGVKKSDKNDIVHFKKLMHSINKVYRNKIG